MFTRHKNKRIRTFDFVENFANRSYKISFVNFLQKMRYNFRVGFRQKFMPARNQILFQRHIIFDNSVVNDDKIPRAIRVRMGVSVGRTTVRRPACVTYSDNSIRKIILEFILQRVESAHSLFNKNIFAAIDRNTRRVVAAILQFRQTLNQKICCPLVADISNNPAHIVPSKLSMKFF